MDGLWNPALPDRQKCYIRNNYRTDTAFTFCVYKNIKINFAKKAGTTTRVTDLYGQALLSAGLITSRQLQSCVQAVCQEYFFKDCHREQAPEDIYRFVKHARLQHFGLSALKAGRELSRSRNCPFDPRDGIDQRQEKEALLARSSKILFLLCDASLFSVMEADIQRALSLGKEAVVCYSPTGGGDLPAKEELSHWLKDTGITYREATEEGIRVDPQGSCLFFYGEEGLLHCRSLSVDSVVMAIPHGYHAQALCNLLGQPRSCTVYIPKGTDITPYVPITARTRLTYRHLADLCRDHGEGIYRLSCEALYEKYPSYFVNIYGNRPFSLPVTGTDFRTFDESREAAVAEFLNSFSNIRYTAAYFDENGVQAPLCFDAEIPQKGILTHSIRVTKARKTQILSCPKGVTPREYLSSSQGTALTSNFLFFMTEKLGVLYNDLRSDRPLEQADAASGHLDYMLCCENGVRKETFPLFAKTCIAGTEDGGFLFFSYALSGGEVQVDGHRFRWEKDGVNPVKAGDICVYTPMCTGNAQDADRETFKLPVGHGRVNIVILKDRVTCIRKGNVLLPSVGVVLSLTEDKAEPLLRGRKSLENGYYDVADCALEVRLDGPEEIEPALWKQVTWAYGGGMGLIREGAGLCDGDMEAWFAREGWMSPLSRQTQESALHKLAKHPRTAIGTTENGDLLVLVYSGRSNRSSGADYREMVAIARTLYPDIRNLMNVDGGGSAMLGMVHQGEFMELSCPATSMGSCVGMVRPINTIFYIPAEREDDL